MTLHVLVEPSIEEKIKSCLSNFSDDEEHGHHIVVHSHSTKYTWLTNALVVTTLSDGFNLSIRRFMILTKIEIIGAQCNSTHGTSFLDMVRFDTYMYVRLSH